MLGYAYEAFALIENRRREDLDDDRLLELSLIRLIEMIGEAANRISIAFRNQTTSIPWSQIICLRHRLIHGYDSVDNDILWEILTTDIPHLIVELEKIIESPIFEE